MTNLRGQPLAFWFCKISPCTFPEWLPGASRAEESFQHLWWVGALVCWGGEDGEKGKCLLGLLPCSVTNLPTQSVVSVVQDQKPVVGRGSHMQGVSLDCQQRRRKNAWAGCGGNQGCWLTAVTSCFDAQIWTDLLRPCCCTGWANTPGAGAEHFHCWCHDNGRWRSICAASVQKDSYFVGTGISEAVKKCSFPQKQGM